MFTTQYIRTMLAAMMLGILVLTSGCFSGDVSVTVNDDGSADLKTTLVSGPMLAQLVEQSKASMVAKNPDAQVAPVTRSRSTMHRLTNCPTRISSPHTTARTRALPSIRGSSTRTITLTSCLKGVRTAVVQVHSRATSRSPIR